MSGEMRCAKLEDVAAAMRAAFNEHNDPGSKVTPWELAAPEKQEAWLVCARAAYRTMFGEEYVP